MLVRESKDSIEIVVANPINTACTVQVSSNIRLYGNGAAWDAQTSIATVPFVLPGGLDAGKSVVKVFSRNQTSAGSFPIAQLIRGISVRGIREGIAVDFGKKDEMKSRGHARVMIFDPLGKLIVRVDEANHSSAISVVKLPATGVVFVRIESGGSVRNIVLPVVR
jgi:aconitase B